VMRIAASAYRIRFWPQWESPSIKSLPQSGLVLDGLKRSRYLIARGRGDRRIVACARIAPADDGAWYVASVAVEPARQGVGTGRLPLDELARQARTANVRALRITVINLREELIAWYERRGFVRTGETEPFPYDDPSVGRPTRGDLVLVKLEMHL